MDITSMTIFFLFMVCTLEGGKTTFCGRKLIDSGNLTYPHLETRTRPPQFIRGGIDGETSCVLFGKIDWKKDLWLRISRVSDGTTVLISTWNEEDGLQEKLIATGENTIQLHGNISRWYKLEFTKTGSNFTLRYDQVKARIFRCDDLSSRIDNIGIVSSSRDRRLGAYCMLQCERGHGFEPQIYSRDNGLPVREVIAVCWRDSNKAPAWQVEDVIFDSAFRQQNLKFKDDQRISCEKIRCNDFPENIKVLSCTNESNINSICNLQCKEGFAPPPHLYERGGTQPGSSNILQFRTTCRFHPKYKNHAAWDPPTSADRLKSFRDPIEPYLDCISLETVIGLCIEFIPSSYIDFYSGRDYTNCPYGFEQLLSIFGESNGDSVQKSPDPSRDEQYVPTPPPRIPPMDLKFFEDLVPTLNDAEWKTLLGKFSEDELRSPACESANFLKYSLLHTPPPMGHAMNVENVDRIFDKIYEAYDCISVSDGSHWPICKQYCKLDTSTGVIRKCGLFQGYEHKRNCMFCKLGKAQGCQVNRAIGKR